MSTAPEHCAHELVLHGSAASPFVRKVRLALVEKSVAFTWSRDYYASLPDFNPLAKVPVLVNAQGERIFDSRVICEYLEFLSPAPSLLPGEPLARLEVKRWEALADGICDAAVAIVNERDRQLPADQASPWLDRQQGKIERGIAWAARELGSRSWCHGEYLSLGDLALFSALRYTQFRLPELRWADRHPELERYCAALEQRPGFAATAPQNRA